VLVVVVVMVVVVIVVVIVVVLVVVIVVVVVMVVVVIVVVIVVVLVVVIVVVIVVVLVVVIVVVVMVVVVIVVVLVVVVMVVVVIVVVIVVVLVDGTGRLMSNAGHTRSLGAELSAVYRVGGLSLAGSYGYTDARFLDYNDGREDYAGGRVPYAPRHTLSVQGEYGFDLCGGRGGRLTLGLGAQGAGRIMWNEANTISQPFYVLMNGSTGWEKAGFGVTLWARNLTGATYNTFYFKSVGRSFVQRGKPLQAGITLFLTL
jgi:hypothetical protein